MQFLKAHYEKVILSVVLLGLAAAAALMPMKVSQEKQREQERNDALIRPKVTEMPPIVLTNSLESLARLSSTPRLKLAGDHNVFNPVRWQKRPDGGVVKAVDAGLKALTIAKINPLKMKVDYLGVMESGGDTKYKIEITKDTERGGRPWLRPAEAKVKNNTFIIEEVRGDPKNPTELVLRLEGEKEMIVLAPNKPYERIIGYSADLRHSVENRTWQNVKVKDELTFGGETYNIVAITENEVVLSAKSNKKQTPIEYKAPQQ